MVYYFMIKYFVAVNGQWNSYIPNISPLELANKAHWTPQFLRKRAWEWDGNCSMNLISTDYIFNWNLNWYLIKWRLTKYTAAYFRRNMLLQWNRIVATTIQALSPSITQAQALYRMVASFSASYLLVCYLWVLFVCHIYNSNLLFNSCGLQTNISRRSFFAIILHQMPFSFCFALATRALRQ